MINIFIGQDDVENVAYHTLCNSIIRNATQPVSITPIKLSHLTDIYNRENDPKSSNEFTYTRFLVPYLSNYEGHSIFMDCDMLCRADISELWDMRDDSAIKVVKHNYIPKDEEKYLGNKQYAYPRKNWSSVILFNNELCKDLTPDYVNTATPAELHRFLWCPDDLIGELPIEWNHLVGEYSFNPDTKLAHFTVGGPYFQEYWGCEFSDEWYQEKRKVVWCEQRNRNNRDDAETLYREAANE